MTKEPKLIDLDEVVRRKAPKLYPKIPRFVLSFAKWLLCVDKINWLISHNKHLDGVEFTSAIVDDLECDYRVVGSENLPSEGRHIFTSNHPLGGFDGISYIKLLGTRYPNIRLIVNDILMFIEPMQSVFLPVNTLGAQKREDMEAIEAFYNAPDSQIMTFPAGFCSRWIDGRVQDIQWKKSVITQAIESQRDIVPMYFDGRNSRTFYALEWIRRKLGMKFNIGLILLPWQTVRHAKGKTFTIYIGKPIPWQTFTDKSRSQKQWAQWLREETYKLKIKN